MREIEERKRATNALLESEAQLHVSERLASVGTLAAGIAHEINNPVGSILAAAQFAQVVERDGGDANQITRALDDLVTQAKRCGAIVRSVLQFSRNEPTEKSDCRLQDIVRKSIRLYEASADENRPDLEISLPERAIWVHVNPIQIEQAIVNLIRNAVEAGSTQIRVRADERIDERLALIEVTDNGAGIPADDRLRIFEPFYTTKRLQGGTGLGLSVVHGIAAEHMGHLKIDGGINGGVAALLELPSIPHPAEPIEEKSEDADPNRIARN